MNAPNLFSFATSELSQDAFICWFLSWADDKYKSLDASLHTCAINFISEAFRKHSKPMPKELTDIKITKQDKNIDVLCVINNEFAIIVEDKTWTKQHSNQLSRYKEEILGREFEPGNIIPIYYKSEEQSNYVKVEKNGYKPFLRDEMIKILSTYEGSNQVLIDYKDHLIQKSQKIASFMYLPINDWHRYSWVGFYMCLQERLSSGHWDYVANPNGGFLGFWWHWHGNDDCEQYLQLEENKLCFKISVGENSDRRKLRSMWHDLVMSQANKENTDLVVVKPPRFGNGGYMTVSIGAKDYRQVDENNIIDIKKTLQILRAAESVLAQADLSYNR